MNNLGSFIYGALGALVMIVAAAIIIPQYSDYKAATETDRWLGNVAETQLIIEQRVIAANSLEASGVDIVPPKLVNGPVQYLEISHDGRIYVKGGSEGQLIVLIPSLEGNKVVWRCLGGASSSVAIICRDPNQKLALDNLRLVRL